MPDVSKSLKDSQVSVRLPNELKDRMESYALMTGRTKSFVAMEALGEYLDWRLPQIEDLKAAVAAADADEFADAAEVERVLSRYDPPAAPKKPARQARPARKA